LPTIKVNGNEIKPARTGDKLLTWLWQDESEAKQSGLTKTPLLQGPIDDGFKSRFLVVLPDGAPDGTAADKWARAEANHFLVRWRSLMRGDAIVRNANEVSEQDMRDYHLAIWGTPNTNSLLRKLLNNPKSNETTDRSLASVLTWKEQTIKLGDREWPSSTSVPVLCYPNPLNTSRYVIVNSGLTFREAHDKTNSLQNPKLPDWAILDITDPPTAESAGKVLAADFFDSRWRWIPRSKPPADRG
jgi:hypothetical protein